MSHSYKAVCNDPDSRMRKTYPWIYWDNAFGEEEIQKICEHFDAKSEAFNDVVEKKDFRNSNVKIIEFDTDKELHWVFQKINLIVEQVNYQYYNFDLNGYDHIRYKEYFPFSEKENFMFHQDLALGNAMKSDMYGTRKLSLSLLLNEPEIDFEGGELQINTSEESLADTIKMKKGQMVLYPSFLIHRISTVKTGKRKSLDVWVEGPKFR